MGLERRTVFRHHSPLTSYVQPRLQRSRRTDLFHQSGFLSREAHGAGTQYLLSIFTPLASFVSFPHATMWDPVCHIYLELQEAY